MIYKANFRDKIHAEFDLGELQFDQVFIKEIWTDEYYFQNGFEIQEGMTVVDVGGHVGLFSVLADKLGANVYTFEPYAKHYRLLVKNLVLNGCQNVIPINGALERFTNRDTLHVQKSTIENHNSGKSYIGASNDDFDEHTIVTMAMDDFFDIWGKKIDYLKLDCEGSEYPILYSMNTDILKSIPFISMEFHGAVEKGRDLEKFLQQCGFTTYFDWAYGEQGRLQAKR